MRSPIIMISCNESSSLLPVCDNDSLDLALIRKYAVNAPRYTSYPPATRFTEDLETLDLQQAITDDNRSSERPLSLYAHLPFCETRCWYCGCTTVITQNRGAADIYINDLAREMALYGQHISKTRRVAQLHLGGGTPTFLSPLQLRRLDELIRGHFRFHPDAELSVEIDPRRLTRDHVIALREMGMNRASLGIQDTDRRVQLAIHRYQPPVQNQRAVEWLRAEGFKSINIDLIYGLPLQTIDSFKDTLASVLALHPDRLSVFGYAHVPWIKPAQKIFEDRGQLPSPEERLALWALAHRYLTEAGFIDIGLDHFARPNDELAQAQKNGTLHRNFQGYSTHAGASLYALGMSSISSTDEVYFQNFRTLNEYREKLSAGQLPVHRGLRLTVEDRQRRTVIMRLMCDRQLDFPALSEKLGLSFEDVFAAELSSLTDLIEDGVVERGPSGIRVTAKGLPLLRVVALRFDQCSAPSANSHSRAL